MSRFWYILIGFIVVREVIIIIGLVTGKYLDAGLVLTSCLFPLTWIVIFPIYVFHLFKEERKPYIFYINSDTNYTISESRYRKYYRKLKKELEKEYKKKIDYLSRDFKVFDESSQEYFNLLTEKRRRIKNYKHFKKLYKIEYIGFEENKDF